MKKINCSKIFLLTLIMLMLAGCTKNATPATLPENEQNTSATMTSGEDTDSTDGKSLEEDSLNQETENLADEEDAASVDSEAQAELFTLEQIDAKTGEFANILLNAAGSEAGDFVQIATADYDGNGTLEAFAFECITPDDGYGMGAEGRLWFVSDDTCDLLPEQGIGCFAVRDNMPVGYGNKTFYMIDECYVTARPTHVWEVVDGRPVENAISRMGNLVDSGDLQFTVTIDAYDGFADGTGHTWKPYYFYYDELKDCFTAYGEEEISIDVFADACGFNLYQEMAAEGCEIINCIRRDNGIWTVNYKVDDRYDNVNWNNNTGEFIDVWGTGENTWQNSGYGGTYPLNE